MIMKFVGAIFAPKQPRHYTGRHRANRGIRDLPVSRDEVAGLVS